MKKKRIAAVLAALLMAIPFAALTACKKEETPPAPLLPDGIGVTVDGVYECDVFDAWDSKVPIVNKDGKRISVASGYMNREGFGASVAVKNYSEESEVAPFPSVAERDCRDYEWKPLGMSYYEWVEALEGATDEATVNALRAEDYVSLVVYRSDHPVAYFVWKYIAHAEGAYFSGEFRFYREEVTRVPIVSKQFPRIGGSYQTIDEEWLEERIETFVEMHREATGQHPA